VGDAPEQQPLERSAPDTAEDDQIRLSNGGGVGDGMRRAADSDMVHFGLRVDAVRLQLRDLIGDAGLDLRLERLGVCAPP
jgi:hypothetical protein